MGQLDFYKQVLGRLKISLAISLFSLALATILSFYTIHLYEKTALLQTRLSSLKSLNVRSQEAAAFIQAHQEDFFAFEACQFERSVGPKTLQEFFQYPIELGPISSLDNISKNNKFLAQNVSFSISCLRDRDVFAFLEGLSRKGPGLFEVYDIKITRLNALTPEILEKIACGNSQVLFNAKIEATWIHQ